MNDQYQNIMNEWEQFSVGNPSDTPTWTEQSCTPLDIVAHVTHIDSSLSIIKSGKITSGLVFDNSKLNTDRILVVWCSPNYWYSGSRYGNVSFEFNFKKLISGKNYYWVESIDYGVKACRILVTGNEHSNLPLYDPRTKTGPWWYDQNNDKHYFNGKYCLEFMFEQDIYLSSLSKISFTQHHPKWCANHRTNPANCPDLGLVENTAKIIWLLQAMSHDVDIKQIKIEDEFDLGYVVKNFLINFFSVNYIGNITSKDKVATTLLWAIMAAFKNPTIPKAKELASLFKDYKNLCDVTIQCFNSYWGFDPLAQQQN